MFKTLLLFIVSICIQLYSVSAQYCTDNHRFTATPFFSESQINIQRNIEYGVAKNWQGQSEKLRLDVYYPILSIDTIPLRPLILMVHGGGLISGDKANYTRVCLEFAKRGFVAVSINYRLGLNCKTDSISEEKAKYRAQQDVQAAFRFVVENAQVLRVDTSWMFIGGGSAGSVAALGTVYVSQNEWNKLSPKLESELGSLNSSGNSLQHTFSIKGVFNDWGAMLVSVLQPNELKPMVSFHGDADSTVAIDSSFGGGCYIVERSYGSRALHNLLTRNGVCSDLSVQPNGGHGVFEDSVGAVYRVSRGACFFKSLFCASCTSSYQTTMQPPLCLTQTSNVNNTEHLQSRVYPNPFTNSLHLQTTEPYSTCTLYNQMGKVVFVGNSVEQQDFSSLPIGIYLLTISAPTKVATYKVVKQ